MGYQKVVKHCIVCDTPTGRRKRCELHTAEARRAAAAVRYAEQWAALAKKARASRQATVRASVVYFVEALGLERIKIGTTTNIEERLTDIQNGCPAIVDLCFCILGGVDEEHELHHRYSHAHIVGEWFHIGPIEAELRALEAAQRIELTVIGCCPDCGTRRSRGKRYPKKYVSGRCRNCAGKARRLALLCVLCGAAGERYGKKKTDFELVLCLEHHAEERERRSAVQRAKVSASMAGNQNARRSARGKVLASL